ncbi:hypothetical protein ES702_05643 [subsurface metagenome]
MSVGERGKKKIVMELILLLPMMSIKRVAINHGQDLLKKYTKLIPLPVPNVVDA